jgi:hypothetical protein
MCDANVLVVVLNKPFAILLEHIALAASMSALATIATNRL